jgi:hypothetical protein
LKGAGTDAIETPKSFAEGLAQVVLGIVLAGLVGAALLQGGVFLLVIWAASWAK